MPLSASLDAHQRLPGAITHCSWQAGWRSLLLRAYDEPGTVEEFTTLSSPDQLIVLTTDGRHQVEVRSGKGWRTAFLQPGSLGMTAAGEVATLRWRDGTPIMTLQLHVPAQAMRDAAESVWGVDPGRMRFPNSLANEDPLIQHAMLALHREAQAGAPDLYAQSAADFLAMHLLWRHTEYGVPKGGAWREDRRMRRVQAYLRERLAEPISLQDLADEAGLSRFHLVRVFKQTFGETPFQRLMRLRIERAKHLLLNADIHVTEVAFQCGYENPAHFASAFRRAVGMPPTAYRRQTR